MLDNRKEMSGHISFRNYFTLPEGNSSRNCIAGVVFLTSQAWDAFNAGVVLLLAMVVIIR